VYGPAVIGVVLTGDLDDGTGCHTGHAYSVGSLLAAISEGIEDALWSAIRADKARRDADAIRTLLTQREPLPVDHD
jgi:hypothetical protein